MVIFLTQHVGTLQRLDAGRERAHWAKCLGDYHQRPNDPGQTFHSVHALAFVVIFCLTKQRVGTGAQRRGHNVWVTNDPGQTFHSVIAFVVIWLTNFELRNDGPPLLYQQGIVSPHPNGGTFHDGM